MGPGLKKLSTNVESPHGHGKSRKDHGKVMDFRSFFSKLFENNSKIVAKCNSVHLITINSVEKLSRTSGCLGDKVVVYQAQLPVLVW